MQFLATALIIDVIVYCDLKKTVTGVDWSSGPLLNYIMLVL